MPMNRTLLNWITRTHRWAYQASDGRIGHTLVGDGLRPLPMLLLTTTGRKSGQQRTTPLLCLPDGERMYIVASNGGAEKPPAWWFNVTANPEVHVQYRRRKWKAIARAADPDERAELWPRLVAHYSDYANYQAGVEREIPVVILTPAV